MVFVKMIKEFIGKESKIEEHLCDILNECQMNNTDKEQIKHNIYEIRKHLENYKEVLKK